MKKVLAIFISVCCAFSIAGCGNSGDDASAVPGTASTQAEETPIPVDRSMQAKTIA